MVIHDKIHLQSPVATVGNCMELDVAKDLGTERTYVRGPGSALVVLKTKAHLVKREREGEKGEKNCHCCAGIQNAS